MIFWKWTNAVCFLLLLILMSLFNQDLLCPWSSDWSFLFWLCSIVSCSFSWTSILLFLCSNFHFISSISLSVSHLFVQICLAFLFALVVMMFKNRLVTVTSLGCFWYIEGQMASKCKEDEFESVDVTYFRFWKRFRMSLGRELIGKKSKARTQC